MKKTILSHFYNEEYLLPWWLKHHKRFFDHGIMIDYNSTDKSCSIIKDICPTWDIVKTRNQYFDSEVIDREVEYYESLVDGWRVCLNTTEFLVGDYRYLDVISNMPQCQILLGNMIFVDTEKSKLDFNAPLYNQITNGFIEDVNGIYHLGIGSRAFRSMHNFAINYPPQGGRHFHGPSNVKNLIIFYYGYLLGVNKMLHRKTQIQNNMSAHEYSRFPQGHPNIVNKSLFIDRITRHQLPKCSDMTTEIQRLIKLQDRFICK